MEAELYPIVRAWLTRARNDLALAEFSIQNRNDLLDAEIYHCQQAAEKAVKAFLVSENTDVPKTHDIRRLIQTVAELNLGFLVFAIDAAFLTPLATEFRYPMDDEAPMPTLAQANEALSAARRIYDFVLSVLPAAAHPL